MTSLWLPDDKSMLNFDSITVPSRYYRTWNAGVCKCGHTWAWHLHGEGRPGTSCDKYRCKCRKYRFRRLRRLGPRIIVATGWDGRAWNFGGSTWP